MVLSWTKEECNYQRLSSRLKSPKTRSRVWSSLLESLGWWSKSKATDSISFSVQSNPLPSLSLKHLQSLIEFLTFRFQHKQCSAQAYTVRTTLWVLFWIWTLRQKLFQSDQYNIQLGALKIKNFLSYIFYEIQSNPCFVTLTGWITDKRVLVVLKLLSSLSVRTRAKLLYYSFF